MKITKSSIYSALQDLAKIAPKTKYCPSVQISAQNNRCTLYTTDQATSLETDVPCSLTIDLPCEEDLPLCCLDLSSLIKLVKPKSRKDDSKVEFSFVEESSKVKIQFQEATFSLSPLPEMCAEKSADVIQTEIFSGKPFVDSLAYVLPAVSQDKFRPSLALVYVGNKVAVATDGHRMHIAKHDTPFDGNMLLPPKLVKLLIKLFSNKSMSSQDIIFSKTEKYLTFQVRNYILKSMIIPVNFPQYEQYIPENRSTYLKVDPVAFLDAVRRISSYFSENEKAVVLQVRNCNLFGSLIISSGCDETGEAKVEVDLLSNDYNEEEDFIVGFNPKYLMEAVDISFDSVSLGFSSYSYSKNDPIVITNENGNFSVVMPMKV